jgi:hypothetical protein
MSNGKKELKPIKQEHNGPTPNYNKKLANLAKNVATSGVVARVGVKTDSTTQYLAGQSIERSSKGTIAADNIGSEIKKGDIIHGATKYVGKSGEIPGDLDFTYKKSSRGGWTITGVGR